MLHVSRDYICHGRSIFSNGSNVFERWASRADHGEKGLSSSCKTPGGVIRREGLARGRTYFQGDTYPESESCHTIRGTNVEGNVKNREETAG